MYKTEKPFEFAVSCVVAKAVVLDKSPTQGFGMLWMIIPAVTVILLVVFIIIKRNKTAVGK